jgi:N-acetyl-anhydromuramyl-L-alanine amidase AmpD
MFLRTQKRRSQGLDFDLVPGASFLTDLEQMSTQGQYTHGYPEGAVIHFTAGSGVQARQTAEWAIKQGHCYLIIDTEGNLVQQFPISRWGWHAGVSRHPRLGTSLSRRLVGIEIQNPGRLELKDGLPTSWFGSKHIEAFYRADQENIKEGYYQEINDIQYLALLQLLIDLKWNAPQIFHFHNIVGHDEISDGKSDPGGILKGMTMNAFRRHVRNVYNERNKIEIV